MLSAFKNFLITFLVAALIFGIVGYFTAGYVSGIISGILDGEKDQLENIISNTPENTKEEEDKPAPVDPDLKVPEGESFTFVVVGTDYRPDVYKNYYHTYDDLDELAGKFKDTESTVGILDTKIRNINATWIAIVRADKENREFVSCYISPETRISTPTGDTTLGDVYGRYGMSVLCEYLEAMTRLDINYTFVIDGINGVDFLSSMGSVKLELSSDIYSGGSYHVSASTSVVTLDATDTESAESDTESAEESSKANENDPPEANAADAEKEDKNGENDDPDEDPVETETVDNVLVLKAGNQSLSDYSIHILNTFKEMSANDVTVKGTYILDILESYLRKCAEWSEEELTDKITELSKEKNYFLEDDSWIDPDTLPTVNGIFDDPYASKPVLATDLTPETVAEIYSMLDAIEYFDYTEYVYPGTYSEEEMMYIPDSSTALEFFAKYEAK